MVRSFACLVFAAALVSLAACTEFSTYCGKKMDCEGGNDKDRSACADQAEGDEDEASDYGCSSQFSALQTCKEDSATCAAGRFSSGASCGQQSKDLEACVGAATGQKH
jgi:hypothetical protein